jgi:hypothetical protein
MVEKTAHGGPGEPLRRVLEVVKLGVVDGRDWHSAAVKLEQAAGEGSLGHLPAFLDARQVRLIGTDRACHGLEREVPRFSHLSHQRIACHGSKYARDASRSNEVAARVERLKRCRLAKYCASCKSQRGSFGENRPIANARGAEQTGLWPDDRRALPAFDVSEKLARSSAQFRAPRAIVQNNEAGESWNLKRTRTRQSLRR